MCRSSRVAGAFAVASLVATATLAAQGLRPKFGVAAGMAVPTGAYHSAASGEGFNSGWQGTALVTLTVPGWPVGLRMDGTYSTHGANDQLKADLTASIGQPTDEKTKLFGVNVDATYPSGSTSRVQPYALGGMGAYHVTISVTSGGSTSANSATRFAWNLGGGVRYRMRGTTVFLEARYVDVTAVAGFPKTTFLPITAGIRFGSP